MRTRMILAVLATALVVAACGTDTGTKPSSTGQVVSPSVLAVKLRALSADDCFTSPATQAPKGCEKYVTEIASTVGMVRQLAGPKLSGLNPLADTLDRSVASYRTAHCETVTAPGDPCTAALTTISTTLRDVKGVVETQATTG
ncbi:hypothetical protein ORV05_28775 [Amycolatopsis cynarae]|uniref:Uncharacterized protein n=1 Tax=Amycolatopsis cynarae TaxID=2995223 RepID=A0ABY7AXY8_9PSEU|nr:hypothetical protein [Amycolatopsis sp. HUAS 11-8]WAL64892.1 hypothetical protein ORV05_28775 [Amycolatopsis sp. HUAS 11-8]